MLDEDQSARAAELIANVQQSHGQTAVMKRSHVVEILVLLTGIMFAIVLVLAFAVIIARQHTIDTLRHQVDDLAKELVDQNDTEAQLANCRTLMANNIAEAQQAADNALNHLVVLISRQIISTIPPNRAAFQEGTDRLESTNAQAGIAVRQRSEWLVAGSPLPCPVSP